MSEVTTEQAYEEVTFNDLEYNGNCYGLGNKNEIPSWSRTGSYYFPFDEQIRMKKTHLPLIMMKVPEGLTNKMLKLRCNALRMVSFHNIVNSRSPRVILVKSEDIKWKPKFDLKMIKDIDYSPESQSDAINLLFFCAGNYWCTGDTVMGDVTKGIIFEWVTKLVGINKKEMDDFKDVCRETTLYVDYTKVFVKLGHALPKYSKLSKRFIDCEVPTEFLRRNTSFSAGNAKLKLCLSILEKLRSDIVWYFYPNRETLKLLFEAREKYMEDPFSYHIHFTRLTGLSAPPSITSISEANFGRITTIAFVLIPESPLSMSSSISVGGTYVGRKYDDFIENFYTTVRALKVHVKAKSEERVKLDELNLTKETTDPEVSMREMEDMIVAAENKIKEKYGQNIASLDLICESSNEIIMDMIEDSNDATNSTSTNNVMVIDTTAKQCEVKVTNFLTPRNEVASSSKDVEIADVYNAQSEEDEESNEPSGNNDILDLGKLSPEDKDKLRKSLSGGDGNDVITLQKNKRQNTKKK